MSEHKHPPEFQFEDEANTLIDERARWKLALNLAEGTKNVPKSFIGKFRNAVRDLCAQTIPRHARSHTKFKMLQALSLFTGKREKAMYAAENFEELLHQGKLMSATVDGKLAGAGSFTHVGTHPDGRPIYELIRISVLPKFRGRKIASQLMEMLQAHVHGMQPDAHILVETKTEQIKQWSRSHGFEKILFADVVKLQGGQISPDELQQLDEQGWEGFLFSPPKQSD